MEVGSAGIGQPFKVLQQYINHIGKEVEVLAKDGRKLSGELKEADEQHFVVTIQKKVKEESNSTPANPLLVGAPSGQSRIILFFCCIVSIFYILNCVYSIKQRWPLISLAFKIFSNHHRI